MIGRFGVMSETQSLELGYKFCFFSDKWPETTINGDFFKCVAGIRS